MSEMNNTNEAAGGTDPIAAGATGEGVVNDSKLEPVEPTPLKAKRQGKKASKPVVGEGVQSAEVVQRVGASQSPVFDTTHLVNVRSPAKYIFPDGFDLQRQFAVCQHLVLSDEPDTLDQHYGAYLAYIARVDELNSHLSVLASRRYVQDGVADSVVLKVGKLGRLVADTEYGQDTLELHTDNALRLFTGVVPGLRPNGHKAFPIDGASRASSALRAIVGSAIAANPFAEQALLKVEVLLEVVTGELQQYQGKYQDLLAKKAKTGLILNPMRSESPARIPITFKTAYGFRLADLVSVADLTFRYCRAMEYRGLLSIKEVRKDIADIEALLRNLFQEIVRISFVFTDSVTKDLTRADWVVYQMSKANPGNSPLSRAHSTSLITRSAVKPMSSEERLNQQVQRKLLGVRRAEKLLGRISEAVLVCEEQPSFVSVRVVLTPEERRLLEQTLKSMRDS